MLAAGWLVNSATAFRVGLSWLELWAKRTPPLVRLALRASVAGGERGKAQATFRDEFIALARDATEVSWRELRRSVDDLDAFTRPDDKPADGVHRAYRVKA